MKGSTTEGSTVADCSPAQPQLFCVCRKLTSAKAENAGGPENDKAGDDAKSSASQELMGPLSTLPTSLPF